MSMSESIGYLSFPKTLRTIFLSLGMSPKFDFNINLYMHMSGCLSTLFKLVKYYIMKNYLAFYCNVQLVNNFTIIFATIFQLGTCKMLGKAFTVRDKSLRRKAAYSSFEIEGKYSYSKNKNTFYVEHFLSVYVQYFILINPLSLDGVIRNY